MQKAFSQDTFKFGPPVNYCVTNVLMLTIEVRFFDDFIFSVSTCKTVPLTQEYDGFLSTRSFISVKLDGVSPQWPKDISADLCFIFL